MNENTKVTPSNINIYKDALNGSTKCYCCDTSLNMFKDYSIELNDNNLRIYNFNDIYYNVCLLCYRKLNNNNINFNDLIEYYNNKDIISDDI